MNSSISSPGRVSSGASLTRTPPSNSSDEASQPFSRGSTLVLAGSDGETIVFVEVRLRRRSDYGGAAASILAAKQARIVLAARHWLARRRLRQSPFCRFDCVLIDGDRLEWLKNAFSAD